MTGIEATSGTLTAIKAYPAGVPTLATIPVSGKVQSNKQDINVIVIILDDVGIEKFQPYLTITGNPNSIIRIPNIKNEIINKGINFNYCWVGPVCGPTRGALESGMYATHSGFGANITATESASDGGIYTIDGNFYLGQDPQDRNTLEKQLIECLPSAIRRGRPNGVYKLGKFGKSHMQQFTGHEEWPTRGEGWDVFKGHMGNLAFHSAEYDHIESFRDGLTTVGVREDIQITEGQLDDILDWLTNDVGDRPFVLWWTPNEGHSPYECPDPARISQASKDEWIAAFGGTYPVLGDQFGLLAGETDPVLIAKQVMMQKHCIEALDSCVGELLSTLTTNAQMNNTMFIVIGDNGTEVSMVEAPFDPGHHKRSTYAGGVRVPLWIAGPLVGQYPRTSNVQVNGVDIFNTILDIVGCYPNAYVPPSTQHARDSISLLPHIKNPAVPHGRTMNFAIRGGPYSGYGWDPVAKLFRFNPANTSWSAGDKDYFLVRLGGTTINEKMFAATDYKQDDDDNLLVTDPSNPLVIEARNRLSSFINVITNS